MYFRPLPNKNVQILDHFFPLIFPKDSESLKILDIRLWEVGAKRPLKGTFWKMWQIFSELIKNIYLKNKCVRERITSLNFIREFQT